MKFSNLHNPCGSQASSPIFLVILVLILVSLDCHITLSQSIQGSLASKFKIFRKGELYAGPISTSLNSIAWKGERITNQIIIWTSGSTVRDISYRLTDLIGEVDTISAAGFSLRFVRYVKADLTSKGCGEYDKRNHDVFMELGDILSSNPITMLTQEDPVKIWVTMDIPSGVNSGDLKGSLIVSAEGKTEMVFDIHISVTDWELPPIEEWSFHMDLWQYPTRVIDRHNDACPDQKLEYWSKEHFSLMKEMYGILADKGQKVITAHIKDGSLGCPSMIKWKKAKNGNWKYDFSVFDEYIDSLTSWGINKQISCQSPVGWNHDAIPYFSEKSGLVEILKAPVGSRIYIKRWNDFLSHFSDHLQSRGLFEKTVLCLDEIEEEKLDLVIKMIKNNDPAWKIGLAGFHNLPAEIDTNIWDMSLHYILPFDSIISKRNNTFYFSCNPPCPNNFIAADAEPAANTFVGWYAYAQNMDGFLRWAYDNWLESDPYEMRTDAHTSGDFCLIYRSSNETGMEFYSSIRLELMRDGIQDYEKLKILEDHLMNSFQPSDTQAMGSLENILKEFNESHLEPGKITELIECGQKLMEDIISQ